MMKKLLALTLGTILAFSLTGCVNEEIAAIMEKNAAAESQYSMVEYAHKHHTYVYKETETHIMTFEQEEHQTINKLIGSSDRISRGVLTTNAGTSIEETLKFSYYQRGNYGYYDLENGKRYRQRAHQANVNDLLGDFLMGLTEDDFQFIRITDLENGGKRLRFRLDPKAIPDETANDFIMSEISFLPEDLGITGAELRGFEFILTLDKDYLTKKQEYKADILLHCEDGNTAHWTYEDSFAFTNYSYRENDHLVFPKDLAEYPDIKDVVWD